MRVLLFRLDDTEFALPAKDTREVVRAVAISPLPGAPAAIEGVISFRGTLAPVYDLRSAFGLHARALSADERMVIAAVGNAVVVFRCSDVVDIRDVDMTAGADLPGVLRGGRTVNGVTELDGRVVVIHDLARFLNETAQLDLERALAEYGRD